MKPPLSKYRLYPYIKYIYFYSLFTISQLYTLPLIDEVLIPDTLCMTELKFLSMNLSSQRPIMRVSPTSEMGLISSRPKPVSSENVRFHVQIDGYHPTHIHVGSVSVQVEVQLRFSETPIKPFDVQVEEV